MKNLVKIIGVVVLIAVFVQSCTGGKEVVLNETPAVQVSGPTWQEIVPGQEDGNRMMIVFLPVANQNENYAIDSIYFKGYHQNMTFKSKSNSGKGYQAVVVLKDDRDVVVPPYELLENQALVSYFDTLEVRRYFKVSELTQKESIFMP